MSDLAQRCAELLEWHKTGLLADGAIRALAKKLQSEMPAMMDHHALHLAETRTNSEALAFAAQQDGAWQPIETAPKDGRFILAVQAGSRDDGEPYVPDTIRWFDSRWDNGMSDRCYFEPTHWMPLQAPPAS